VNLQDILVILSYLFCFLQFDNPHMMIIKLQKTKEIR